MGDINLGQSSCLNLDTKRNVRSKECFHHQICESYINYHKSALHGLPTVIVRCPISLVLMWSNPYVSTLAATNFVFNKQSVSLLPVHCVAGTIQGQSSTAWIAGFVRLRENLENLEKGLF